MESFKFICDEVRRIMRKYDETDPFLLCKELGITVRYAAMGDGPDCCKGFFLTQSRIRVITINSDLSYSLRKIICAHELGHAVLHGKYADIKAFHDFALFDSASRYEYEANIFAAEFLLQDIDVLETLNDDLSFFQAAPELHVPAEILDFKFRILKWKGYKVMDAPLMAQSDFLKNIADGGEKDDYVC